MPEAFGGHIRGPEDAGIVIVVYDCWFWAECGEELKVIKDMVYVENVFRTFISCIYFCFSCAPSCDSLSFGCPVKGSIEPLNVSRHGARVKEWNVV